MKLKKFAALALAGVMAVSMLAGCAGKGTTDKDDSEVTTPAGSIAEKVDAKLENKVIKLSDDATASAWLSSAIESADLKADDLKATGSYNKDGALGSGDVFTAVQSKVNLLMKNATMLTSAGKATFSGAQAGVKYEGTETKVLLYTVQGAKSEDVAISTFAKDLDVVLTDAVATTIGSGYVMDHEYAGKVAMQKVTQGDLSAYVFMIVIDHTCTATAL